MYHLKVMYHNIYIAMKQSVDSVDFQLTCMCPAIVHFSLPLKVLLSVYLY